MGFRAVVWKSSTNLCRAHTQGLKYRREKLVRDFGGRSRATLVAVSVDDVRSMEKLWGKKATVQESRIELVEGM